MLCTRCLILSSMLVLVMSAACKTSGEQIARDDALAGATSHDKATACAPAKDPWGVTLEWTKTPGAETSEEVRALLQTWSTPTIARMWTSGEQDTRYALLAAQASPASDAQVIKVTLTRTEETWRVTEALLGDATALWPAL